MRIDFLRHPLRFVEQWLGYGHKSVPLIIEDVGTNLSSRLHVEVISGEDEITLDEVQALRYHVFYEELAARGKRSNRRQMRDFDKFDVFCDHIIVRDDMTSAVVGACRLLRREGARQAGKFYTSQEFDIRKLTSQKGDIAELGRFCLHPSYRKSLAVILVWRALAEYLVHYDIRYLFGCGSFKGKKPKLWARELTWLWRHHLAPEDMRPRAKRRLRISMNRDKKMPQNEDIDKEIWKRMPSLLKAYLRAGAMVGDGAVIDKKFNTVDVCVVFKVDELTKRYLSHKPVLDKSTLKNGIH